MPVSDSRPGANEEAASEFFGIGLKHASTEALEIGLVQLLEIQQILSNSGLTAPAATWTNAIHAVECELLERSLLK